MNDKLNAIIDTNVIISSLLTSNVDSATVKVMELFYNDEINVYYSDEIYKEYEEVMQRAKFNFEKERIEIILSFIKQSAIKLNPKSIDEKMIDIKDKPFYEILLDKRIVDGKLITGNIKHFPNNCKIITPSEFMDIYNSRLS